MGKDAWGREPHEVPHKHPHQVATSAAIFLITAVVIGTKAYTAPGAVGLGAMTTDPATGITFSPTLVVGGTSKALSLLGAGVRVKKIGPLPVKVYSVALYADVAATTKSLGAWSGTGPISARDLDFYAAVTAAKADQALHLNFARAVGADKVAAALADVPGVPQAALDEFGALIKTSLGEGGVKAGETITLKWSAAKQGELGVDVRGKAVGTVKNAALPVALFNLFLGPSSISPALRFAIADNALSTLFSCLGTICR